MSATGKPNMLKLCTQICFTFMSLSTFDLKRIGIYYCFMKKV